MKRIFLGAALTLAGMAMPAFANFDKAMESYTAGNFTEAYRSFDALAAIGDYSSAFNIGVMHYRGEYVEQDPVEGWAWMQLAASQSGSEDMMRTAGKIFAALDSDGQKAAQQRLDQLLHTHGKETILGDLNPVMLSDEECEIERTPIAKTQPRYPTHELRRGRFGRVVLEYSVMPAGHVRDVTVAQSSADSFANAAAESALSYRYEPAAVTEPTSGVKTAVSFNITGPVKNQHRLVAELNEWKGKAEAGDAVAQYVYAYRLGVFRSFRRFMKGVDLEYQAANKWYLEAARQGIPQAQFEIGRNMVMGRGCKADTENGLKWITAAAAAGVPEAQNYLATSVGAIPEADRREHAIRWLKNAASNGHYFSGLLLAWELVSGPGAPSAQDLALASDLVAAKPVNYFDEVRILETKAAVAAAQGSFKTAQKLQKRAIKTAGKLEWDLRDANHRQAAYLRGEKWSGPYYFDIELAPGSVQVAAE
ncbi:TonB family protein [Microbulbifer salipaludis]|uniref:TonB family protein n=1 Tax=Microbulbifer salipaludis TaxID=187980 RepID=A0ABS3E320_9GAMM|nr:TonB family protein [Microbulbifer salipaludis]MBN8429524.1 TonB family protein [Microbulbifer salipaludis]